MLLNCGVEKTLESPLDCKAIKTVNRKGNQPWVFIGRTDARLTFQYFGHLMPRTDSLGKTLMLGRTEWTQEEKGMTEDEMFGWHHQFNGQELEQAPGVGNGQGSLVCWIPWGHEELYTTQWLNWTECSKFSSIPYWFLKRKVKIKYHIQDKPKIYSLIYTIYEYQ